MASFITAGNATNGLQVSSDNTGILELRTGTGSGTTAVTIGATQNAIFAGNVGVGTSSPSGNFQISGANPRTRLTNTSGTAATVLQGSDSGVAFIGTETNTPYYFVTNNTERARIDTSGNVLVTGGGGLGYGTGSGGTVTQTTNKSTAVTLNKITGQITMSNSALGAAGVAVFICNNSLVTTSDVVVVTPSNNANYTAICQATTAGQFYVRVTNITAGSLSEAVVISFAIIKGATA